MGIEASLDTPLAKAVRIAGSQSAFARLVGKSQASVYDALKNNRPLWDIAVLMVEAETGIPRHALRPDLYPDESSHDAAVAADRHRPAEPRFEPAR